MSIPRKKWLVFTVLILFFSSWTPSVMHAEAIPAAQLEEYRQLLEKGLTLYEIDAELERISTSMSRISEQIDQTEERLSAQQITLHEKQQQAGRILRAYYSGERINLLMVIFRINNFSDAWSMIEYLGVVFQNDREIMNRFKESYLQLQQTHEQLMQAKQELQDVQNAYLAERQKLIALQEELDKELEQREDAEQVLEDIRQLTAEWEESGLPAFRTYLSALANAVSKLPDLLIEHDDMLAADGFTWTLRLDDDRLNDFLRQHDDRFHSLQFQFEQDRIVASGEDDGVSLYLAGIYTLEEEPISHIGFKLQELRFQGYELPDTTREALSEQFDLGIYPTRFVPFVKATDVEMNEGELKVYLTFSSGTSTKR